MRKYILLIFYIIFLFNIISAQDDSDDKNEFIEIIKGKLKFKLNQGIIDWLQDLRSYLHDAMELIDNTVNKSKECSSELLKKLGLDNSKPKNKNEKPPVKEQEVKNDNENNKNESKPNQKNEEKPKESKEEKPKPPVKIYEGKNNNPNNNKNKPSPPNNGNPQQNKKNPPKLPLKPLNQLLEEAKNIKSSPKTTTPKPKTAKEQEVPYLHPHNHRNHSSKPKEKKLIQNPGKPFSFGGKDQEIPTTKTPQMTNPQNLQSNPIPSNKQPQAANPYPTINQPSLSATVPPINMNPSTNPSLSCLKPCPDYCGSTCDINCCAPYIMAAQNQRLYNYPNGCFGSCANHCYDFCPPGCCNTFIKKRQKITLNKKIKNDLIE